MTRFRRTAWSWNSPYPFRSVDYCGSATASKEIPYPCAGAFLIHRKAFEDVGGWDTRFFLDVEDVDLGIRLWKHGWKSVSVPEAKVFHEVGASNNQAIKTKEKRVGIKRYASARSNIMMVQIKHAKQGFLFAVPLWWALEVVKKIAKGDRELVMGALRAGVFVARNLSDLLVERKSISSHGRGLAPFFQCSTFNES